MGSRPQSLVLEAAPRQKRKQDLGGSSPQSLNLEDGPKQKRRQDQAGSSFSKKTNGDAEVILRVPRSNSVSSEASKVSRPSSVNSDRKSRKSTETLSRSTVPVIDEEKELGSVVRNDTKYASNGNLSNASNGGSGSRSGRKYQRQSNGVGVVNAGYTGSTPSIASSMPVIQEQYCYCSRWTKLEKILLTIVSVLAFMVLVLIIAVGVLADKKHNGPNLFEKLNELSNAT